MTFDLESADSAFDNYSKPYTSVEHYMVGLLNSILFHTFSTLQM